MPNSNRPAAPGKGKVNFMPGVWTLAIAINVAVALAFCLPEIGPLEDYDLSRLPLLNAIFNSLTFLSLAFALYWIKKGNIKRHRQFIFSALFWTALFLASYLAYHFSTPPVKFGGEGFIRNVYFFILLTHIPLAVVIVPIALITITRGLQMDAERHRKIARWAMPIWLYVSLTGVAVYLMNAPYYP